MLARWSNECGARLHHRAVRRDWRDADPPVAHEAVEMTFNNKADAVEGRLMEKGFRIVRGKRNYKIYTDRGFGHFSRKRINEILEIADRTGVDVSGSQPFLLHIRELKGIRLIKGVKPKMRG